MTPNQARFLVDDWACLGYVALEHEGELWGREAEYTILYLYRKALIVASERMCLQAAFTLTPQDKHPR